MPTESSSPPRYGWLKRIALVYVAAALLLTAVTALWMWRSSVALRAFQAKLRADGGPATADEVFAIVESARNRLPSSALTDATAFMVAASPLDHPPPAFASGSPIDGWHDAFDRRQPLAAEDVNNMRHWITWQKPSLEVARPLLDGRLLDCGILWRKPLGETRLPHLNSFRTVTNGIADEASLQHLDGDDAAFVRSVSQILTAADALRQPAVIGVVEYVSARHEAKRAYDIVEAAAASLKVSDARDASADVAQRTGTAVRPASRAAVEALIRKLWDQPSFEADFTRMARFERLLSTDTAESEAEGDGILGWIEKAAWRAQLNARDDAWFPLAIRGLKSGDQITAERLDWVAPASMAEGSHFYRITRDIPKSAFPKFDRPVVREFVLNTNARAAATLLAIRLFELDHGRVPDPLEELVPSYLSAVPADTTSEGAPPLTYIHGDGIVALYAAHAALGTPLPTTLPSPLPAGEHWYAARDTAIVYRGHERIRPR